MKRFRIAGDVSALPTYAFGNRNIHWWGTLMFMTIEGMTIAVCAAAYLYVRKNFEAWPPPPTPLPDLVIPTIAAVLMVLSIAMMTRVHVATRKMDLRGVQRWLVIMVIVGIVLVALRWFEFKALNTRWDSNAYGSTAWATVAFHSTLLLFEVVETAVFAALMLFGPREKKHFTDVEDDAVYWYFMAAIWVPLYVLVYVSPHFA